MNDVVDRILNAYQLKRPLDAEQVADSRQRIERYIESLASAGQRDAPDRPALSFQDSIRPGRKNLGRFHGTQCAAGHRRIGSSDRLVTSIAIFAAAAHDPRRDRILRALHPETGVQRSVVEPRLVMMFSWGHYYLTLKQKAIEPPGQACSNAEIFRRLVSLKISSFLTESSVSSIDMPVIFPPGRGHRQHGSREAWRLELEIARQPSRRSFSNCEPLCGERC
jgi:hypothetical protein